ncbi:MAG: LuxR C-terminal-related transcriptional regulator [Chloroflexi bacterium]|nr:LuxR C-terminal-related transcriptional regulator [Chloroflexota bacterium]
MNGLMGLALDEGDVAALEDRTEGWVVGLQLAGLSMRDRTDPAGFIAGLSGSHRYILSYLTEQVLGRQPSETTDFLLATSILDKLTGDLCDAVTGRSDSAALLERLFTANLFLVPMDDEQHWYRYHHLFADLLTNRLRQTFPVEAIQRLHCRASEWLAQNGLLDEAVRHAFQGKDYERAIALVEQAARGMMFAGRASALRNWLDAVPEESFRLHPRLSIYRLWIDLMQGKSDLSERALQADENLLRDLPPSSENDKLRRELMVVLCRFVALTGNTKRAIRLAEEALDSLPESDLASRARAHSALAIAFWLEGQVEQGERAYAECLRLAQAAGYYSLAAHTTMVMAMGLCNYGRLHEAARYCQSIVDMGRQARQKIFYPAGQGHIGLAGIHLEWNDLEAAEDHLSKGMELCEQGGLAGVSTGYAIGARLRQAKGDLEGALEQLRLARNFQAGADPTVSARHLVLRRALGDVDEVARLASPLFRLLSAGQGSGRLAPLVVEDLQAMAIRALLALGETERAREMLDKLEATAEPAGRRGRLIEVYLLRALALTRSRESGVPSALECFERALDLAEPEGYVRLFLEEGTDVIPLLNAVAGRPGAPERLIAYARKLLNAFPAGEMGRPGEKGTACQPNRSECTEANEMVESLSRRELQVLRLMAQGLTYEQVGQQLAVTVNTVRFHVKGIYGKLGVGKRSAAVDKARSLRLLD